MPFLSLGLKEESGDRVIGSSGDLNPKTSDQVTRPSDLLNSVDGADTVAAEDQISAPKQTSALPPAIEELREKISEKVISDIGSVHSSPDDPIARSPDPDCVPTFSTFKF